MKQDMNEDTLIKYALGEATPAEIKEIEMWTAKDEANALKFERVKIILESSRQLSQKSPRSENDAWKRFKEIRASSQNKKQQVRPIYNNKWLQLAAAMTVITGGGWLVYNFLGNQKSLTAQINLVSLNSVRIDTLPDGSIVHMNKHSAITYSKDRFKRKVKLTGEAFFDVKHDVNVPFTVSTNDVEIVDVGTSFNVNSKLWQTEIIVESGIVRVTKNNDFVELKAKQALRVTKTGKRMLVTKNDDQLYNYYRTNKIIANHTPLGKLVEVLNEAYGDNIIIKNNSLLNTPITVTIELHYPIRNVLSILKSTTPEMKIEESDNSFVIH